MLNISLLRKAQESILNRSRKFDLNNWCDCIAGHIVHAAREQGINVSVYWEMREPWLTAARLAGISDQDARELFQSGGYSTIFDRQFAVARIDDLIRLRDREVEKEVALVPVFPRVIHGVVLADGSPGAAVRVETPEEDLVCV